MNDKLNNSIKLGLWFGIISSVVLPLGYEIYGNLSRNIAIFLLCAYGVYVGIRFCKVPFREAFIGLAEMFALGFGLTLVTFMLIHPASVKFLNSHSKYFSMSTTESFKYFIKAGVVLLLPVIICGIKGIFQIVVKKIRRNGEMTKNYIDNAFDD